MKKSLVLAGLLLGSTVAMADTYIGVDYGISSNTVTNKITGQPDGSYKNNYSSITIKLGTGEDGGFKFQGKLALVNYDKPVVDNTHKNLIEYGVDAIKEFSVYKEFYPFLKLGIAGGYMQIDGYNTDIVAEVSFNVGIGLSYKVADSFYIVGGLDYAARKWQDREVIYIGGGTDTTISTTESGTKPYIGINYSF